MKFIFLTCAFSLLSFLAKGAEMSKAEAILDNEIEVSLKNEYSWMDLVRLTKPSDLVLRNLAEMKISSDLMSTSSARTITLSRIQILKVIKASGLKDLGLLWQIPETVKIKMIDQISSAEIERRISNQLQAQCESCDIEIFIERIPAVKARNWKIKVTDLTIKNSLLVPIEGDGKNIWVSARIKAYRDVPVTTRLIPAQQKIQAGDLEMKRLDSAIFKDGFLSIEQMIGMSMNRSLSVGTPVGASDVKREAAIKKGQLIKALIENSDFEIQSNAMAEEAGYVGDLIKVRSSDNQKLMMGKIKDNNSVVIQ